MAQLQDRPDRQVGVIRAAAQRDPDRPGVLRRSPLRDLERTAMSPLCVLAYWRRCSQSKMADHTRLAQGGTRGVMEATVAQVARLDYDAGTQPGNRFAGDSEVSVVSSGKLRAPSLASDGDLNSNHCSSASFCGW